MKLSEALELCIERKIYSKRPDGYRFMCHALENSDQGEHVPAVMEMVWAIEPRAYALGSALNIDRNELTSNEMFDICKAHYIKWIAELKEQGM